MSVMLTGLRRRQELEAAAKKPKSKPKKHDKSYESHKHSAQSSSLLVTLDQQAYSHLPVNSYVPSDNVAVWNLIMNKVQISIALMKENFEVWVNDVEVETDLKDENNTVVVSFELFDKVAVIKTTCDAQNRMQHEMRIDGQIIPEVRPL